MITLLPLEHERINRVRTRREALITLECLLFIFSFLFTECKSNHYVQLSNNVESEIEGNGFKIQEPVRLLTELVRLLTDLSPEGA